MTRRSIRVLTLIESSFVSGPARILIEFGRLAAIPESGLPLVELAVATYWRGQGESPVAEAARSVGLSVFTITERGRCDRDAIPQLRRIVSDYQLDILESRNLKSHFLARLLGLQKGRPWIARNHGYTARDWLDRAHSQLDHWSLHGAFGVVTVCGPFAKELQRRGIDKSKITILPNFVKPIVPLPPGEVEQLRDRLGLQDKAVILAVGRLSSEKGHAFLLQPPRGSTS